jgi:hypothetical protein
MDPLRRCLAQAILVAAMAASAVACASGPPSPDQMAATVVRLDAVVPIVADLHVIGFEDSAYCRSLDYERGTFAAPTEGGCTGDGTDPFDAVALADHLRLAEAIRATGSGVIRILRTTFTAQDELETAWLKLHEASIADDWEYLYDPTGAVLKVDQPGRLVFTRIDDDWWFVVSFDD